MQQLNYKHLRYFWAVAHAGSQIAASQRLHLTPQSISGQITMLEESLGLKLFKRVGRGLELTEAGRRLLTYADKIFALGDELVGAMRDRTLAHTISLRVGIEDAVPKIVAYRLVQPVVQTQSQPTRLICREGRMTQLLGDLAVNALDLVVADRPMPEGLHVRGHDFLLSDSAVGIYARPALRQKLRKALPKLLHNAPFLMPGAEVAMHARLLRWFETEDIRPRIVGEFDDSALLHAFGQAGAGFFAAAKTDEAYLTEQLGVELCGEVSGVREQLYAITTERSAHNPLVALVCQGHQPASPAGSNSAIPA